MTSKCYILNIQVFMNLFGVKHIYLDLDITNKDALFDFISSTLMDMGRITESKDFKVALEKREAEISTGLGEGLGMPHALDTSVLFPTLLYIRLKEAIAYDAIDGNPVKEIFAIAMPNSYQKEHLELLSQIAKIYLDTDLKAEIRATKTPKATFELLSKNLK